MSTISLKDAEAKLSTIVEQARAGEFVTITRRGKPAAVLVSVDAADTARRAAQKTGAGFADHLLAFPDIDDDVLERRPSPSRDVEL